MTISGDKSPLVSEIVIAVFFILLLCAPIFDNIYGGLFSYADEIAAIVLTIWGLLSKDCQKVSANEKNALGAMGCLCLLGLFGNLLYDFQDNIFAIGVDAFTCMKLFVAFLAARIVLKGKPGCLKIFQAVGKIFLIAAGLGLLLHVAGIVHLGSGRTTFGIPCYQFFFNHPTNLAAFSVGIAALMFVGETPKRGWLVGVCVLLVSTQRARAVAMAFIIFFFMVYGAKQYNRKPSKFVFVFLAVAAVCIGADQIQEYFLSSTTSARILLVQNSFDVANRCFPLGSGFATFGTYMSGEYYSPLYYEYGLNTVWGLYPSDPQFVSDSFWPAVVAQFGYLGLLAILFLFVSVAKSLSQDAKRGGIRFAAYGIIPLYLIILSTSDSSFFNFYGPFYALILGAIVNHVEGPVKASACNDLYRLADCEQNGR